MAGVKAVKKILKIIVVILILLIIFIMISYVNHRIKLNEEEELFKPLGETVDVDGKKMSVYTEGKGDKTLVFMSGGGTGYCRT